MLKPGGRLFRLFVGMVACASLPVFDSSAQSYPVKPVRMVVGFSAGSGSDTLARMVAQKLPEHLGQPIVVENRAGAGGAISAERVATAPPDGYTLLLVTASYTILPALNPKLPYDLERDLVAVSLVVDGTYVLIVHPSVPARSVRELIALARSRPGKLSYATSGVGTRVHLATELFNLMAKVNIVHVAYKGGADAVIATTSGQIDMSFASVTAALPLINAGRLWPLAVSTAKRASLMPAIPTLDESGLRGYDYSNWYGVSTRAGVPKDVIARLNAAIAKAVNTPDMKEAFDKQGFEPRTNTPEQFATLIHHEIAQNAKLVKLIGLKAE